MASVVAMLPSISMGARRVEIPDMRPEERDKFVRQLGNISNDVVCVATKVDERGKSTDQQIRAVNARLAKLEAGADATGQHDLVVLQKALDKSAAALVKVKWFVVTLIASTIVGLVVGYLSHG